MFNNLRTDPSDQSGSLEGVMNPSMRQKMQNLTINDMQSEDSLSSKDQMAQKRLQTSARKLKKRRFKEIDNTWDLNLDQDSQSVIATQQQQKADQMSDETLSLPSSRKGNNRRCIKINSKKIQRICAEMDLKRNSAAKVNEQAKIMGSFCILMYDLQTDNLHKMKYEDQAVIRESLTAQTRRRQHNSNPDFGCLDQ